jgi:hypothetical protein
LALELPVERIAFRKDGGSWHSHFRIMAVLRSPTRGIVEKFVQDSPVEVPDSRYEALKRGNIFFTRSFTLEPGRYRLETVVEDEIAKKRSVRKSAVLVPPDRPPLALSSLALVKKTEAVTAGALETDDPFRFGQIRLVPYVGEPTVTRGESLSLFFTAFAGRDGGPTPELALEFVDEGAVVARSTTALPPPDEKGRIPYIVTIPSEGLPPGRVELRATVRRGPHTSDASTFFTVAPAGVGVPPPAPPR